MKLFVTQNINAKVYSLSDLNKIYNVVYYKVAKLLKTHWGYTVSLKLK